MSPLWMLLAVALVGVPKGEAAWCRETEACNSIDLKNRLDNCVKYCTYEKRSEKAVLPGDAHLDPSVLAEFPDPTPPKAKRSYSMEHFRWGKPVGRKRRPVRLPDTPDAPDDYKREMEVFEKLGEALPDENGGVARMAGDEAAADSQVQEAKRYGGFMKAYDDERQKPLVMLLKNVINKDEQN